MIKLIIKFKILKRKKDLRKKKRPWNESSEFLKSSRETSSTFRYIRAGTTSGRRFPQNAIGIESFVFFIDRVELRLTHSRFETNQPTNQLAAAIACLRLSYGKRCREEELRLVARNPLLAEAGGGRRKAAGPPGFFRKWTSPSSIRYLHISLVGRIPDLQGNYKYYITFDKNTMRL